MQKLSGPAGEVGRGEVGGWEAGGGGGGGGGGYMKNRRWGGVGQGGAIRDGVVRRDEGE